MRHKLFILLTLLTLSMFTAYTASAKPQNDEQIKDILLTVLSTYISNAVTEYYGEPRQYGLYDAEIVRIERDQPGGFSFRVYVVVKTFVGAHNPPYGEDSITLSVTPAGVDVEKFVHKNMNTGQNSEFLRTSQITLRKPVSKPLLSEKEAVSNAKAHCNVIARRARGIVAEYCLMTNPGMTAFSKAALTKNAQLRHDGYLKNTPVYIVIFKGVHLPGKHHTVFEEHHVVLDANSGEILFSYSN
ncbi:DUF3888 domain-containing protein [Paenibacillus gansuensis]|uniref:DUF3888 domain-containing protein n=1 Tax=Paenibacillus gansuensis TaxID=306542 RepID=A0ABW5PG05_9BACL